MSAVDVAIRDENGIIAPMGESGEVCVAKADRDGGLLEQSRSDRAGRNHGWLWTGDLGAIDAGRLSHPKDHSKGPDHLWWFGTSIRAVGRHC